MKALSIRKVFTGISILLFLAGCKSPAAIPLTPTMEATPSATVAPLPTSTPPPPTATSLQEGPVFLGQYGTILIGGTIYGHGKKAVILASRGGYSQYEWSLFAITLSQKGYTTLTLGSSDGEGTTVQYVLLAIEFLRANGFTQIVCMGASNGASGCAYNAHVPEMKGLVLLTYHGSADLSNVNYPKIFIAGETSGYKNSTEKGYNAAAEPKTLFVVPGSADSSPALLDSPGMDLNQQVVDMLKEVMGY